MELSYFLTFLLAFGFAIDSTFSLSQQESALIDAVIEEYQIKNLIPGLALSVIQNGETVLVKGFGKRDVGENLDVDNNTLFAIGSVTKSICSLIVVKVLNEKFPELGESALDTPIQALGDNLNFTLSDRFRTESTTFRDLLSHRHCIIPSSSIFRFGAVTSFEEYIYRTRYNREACSHRAGYTYNSAMYAVAGDLIGKIAGTPYPELVTNFFGQLGMSSSITIDAEGSHEDLPDMSRAYTRNLEGVQVEFDKTHLRRLRMIGGGGDVISSASDMAKYVEFYFNKGKVGDLQVIPENVLNWMYRLSVPVTSQDMPVQTGIYGYSLGLFISLVEGRHRTGHTGFWPPYESSFSLFPLQNNSNVGIFTSINGPGFTGEFPDQLSQEDVHLLILEILEGSLEDLEQVNLKINRLNQREAQSMMMMSIEYQRESEAQDQKRSSRWSVLRQGSRKHVYRQKELVGLYGSAEHGEINIEENGSDNGTLGIRYGNWGIGTLTPSSTEINTYDVEWSTTINYDFYAFRRFFPLPVFKVYFGAPDQLDFVQDRLALTFRRDATLDTFPEIPWSPESCGPSTSTPPRR